LVATDEPALRTALLDLLEQWGHHPVPAADGAEAMTLASTQRLDAIVIHMHLAVMDGETVTRLLRNSGGQNADIPGGDAGVRAKPGPGLGWWRRPGHQRAGA
jgi:CheY-like chemotaxis protein